MHTLIFDIGFQEKVKHYFLFLCRLRSIVTHRDHFVRRLSVCLSDRLSHFPKLCFAGDTCIPRNFATIFKDWIHHCDPQLGEIRIHGWYFCSYTLLKHIWASCKIFCRLGDCKKHQNDLKCGDLVDFVASKSHFVLWKWSLFGFFFVCFCLFF